MLFRNKNIQKYVTNLFDWEFLDYWNDTFILIFYSHHISIDFTEKWTPKQVNFKTLFRVFLFQITVNQTRP